MFLLRNRTIILTGASHGIGRALAPLLAERGTCLVLNARGAPALNEAAEECRKAGTESVVSAVAGDASDPSVAERLVQEARAAGQRAPFFGLIHAAAVFEPGPLLWELEPERFQSLFTSSVFATYQLARYALPVLRAQGDGLFVVFGSGAAFKVQAGIAAYGAAKAAEEHLARHIAVEAPEITTFIFRPGIVDTRLQAQARDATGGGSREIRGIFRAWKEKAMLLTPGESAARLVQLIEEGPRKYHGQVEESMEIRTVGGQGG
jgi:NAD(P)-dependent dehydrogenase (short-subunit alcohol dehydrogenase family)